MSDGSTTNPSPHSVVLHLRQPGELADLRRHVLSAAQYSGLTDEQAANMAMAATEIATNALRHGGGQGQVTINSDGQGVHVEIIDDGNGLQDRPVDTRPNPSQPGGRGLWLAAQLCDDLTIDTSPAGTTVRLATRRPAESGAAQSE